MTVLVTGATGFVGRHLVRSLLEQGSGVRALVRRPDEELAAAGVECVIGDIRDEAALHRATRHADVVYHGAVVPLGGSGDMWGVNVRGTSNVARASVANGVRRLIYLSSETVYRKPMARALTEDAPIGGIEPYGRSKSRAERIVRETCGESVEFVIVRPCQIYGSRDRSGHTRLLFDLAGRRIVPVARGSSRFSLVHIDDVVDALDAAATLPAAGEVFNIAGPAKTSLRELAAILTKLGFGPRRVVPVPRTMVRSGLIARWALKAARNPNVRPVFRSYGPDAVHGSIWLGGPEYVTEKASRLLGFEAKVDSSTGVARTLAATPPGGRT